MWSFSVGNRDLGISDSCEDSVWSFVCSVGIGAGSAGVGVGCASAGSDVVGGGSD